MTRDYQTDEFIKLIPLLTDKEKNELYFMISKRFGGSMTDEDFDKYSNEVYRKMKEREVKPLLQ